MSFIRVIPKLLTKFASLGAVAGGTVIAGVSYVQYQAGRKQHSSLLKKTLIVCRGW
jgi:uncharacterized membrane protein YebE (DUF533 family)